MSVRRASPSTAATRAALLAPCGAPGTLSGPAIAPKFGALKTVAPTSAPMDAESSSGEAAPPVPQKLVAFSLHFQCSTESDVDVAIVNKHSVARGLRLPAPGEVQTLAPGYLLLEFDHSYTSDDALEDIIDMDDVLGTWVTETGSNTVHKARLVPAKIFRGERDGGTTQYNVQIEKLNGKFVTIGQRPGEQILTITIMYRQT